MKQAINYENVQEKEKRIKALVECFEWGFEDALESLTSKQQATSCTRIEKTSLNAILELSDTGTNALEVRYHTGLAGSLLLLIRPTDLFRLAEVLSGDAGKVGGVMTAEIVDSCLHFFSAAVDSANSRFFEQYQQKIDSEPPELINPDGKSGSLAPLAGSYDGVLCASFQIIVNAHLDGRLQWLVQPDLLESLGYLIPDYDPNPQVKNTAETRTPSQQWATERPEERVAAPPPKQAVQQDGRNWNIDLLLDVELPIVVSFGESEMQLKDVLKLGVGSVVELNKGVNDLVTIIVNQKPIARGEVVMVDGSYGVRILEVESTAERIRSLG